MSIRRRRSEAEQGGNAEHWEGQLLPLYLYAVRVFVILLASPHGLRHPALASRIARSALDQQLQIELDARPALGRPQN